MTYKPLDLQMSVPRTQEFSNMQQQAAQKPAMDQTMLEGQAAKHTEELRMHNSAVEQTGQAHVRANQDGKHSGAHEQRKRTKESVEGDEDKPEQAAHPFKGHHLDIKL
ncbi:hypothetical protein [Paenibacillus sp. HB172176]|uniref:hypothetical protein n=1 Tax=Paenibacillus sp. HB172176 TaxID=2493690 RepID=UPI001438707C|nr:hypothetical protein [Paenibacillus sp. HB172176]